MLLMLYRRFHCVLVLRFKHINELEMYNKMIIQYKIKIFILIVVQMAIFCKNYF